MSAGPHGRGIELKGYSAQLTPSRAHTLVRKLELSSSAFTRESWREREEESKRAAGALPASVGLWLRVRGAPGPPWQLQGVWPVGAWAWGPGGTQAEGLRLGPMQVSRRCQTTCATCVQRVQNRQALGRTLKSSLN